MKTPICITLKRTNKGWECKLTPLPNNRRVPIVPRPITAGTKKRSWSDDAAVRVDTPPPYEIPKTRAAFKNEERLFRRTTFKRVRVNVTRIKLKQAENKDCKLPSKSPQQARRVSRFFNKSKAADAAAVRVDTSPAYKIPKTRAALKNEKRLFSVMKTTLRAVRVDVLRHKLKQAENKDCKLVKIKSPCNIPVALDNTLTLGTSSTGLPMLHAQYSIKLSPMNSDKVGWNTLRDIQCKMCGPDYCCNISPWQWQFLKTL